MVAFIVDPSAVAEAVLKGKCLLVQVGGPDNKYRKVTVVDRPGLGPHPQAVAIAKRA